MFLILAVFASNNQSRVVLVLVFIDESGDPGFSVHAGASSVFVLCAVIFPTGAAASSALAEITHYRTERRWRSEFKFNKCDERVRDSYIQLARRLDFRLAAVAVRKTIMEVPDKLRDKEGFYEHFARILAQQNASRLLGARVVFDGRWPAPFQKRVRHALKSVQAAHLREIQFRSSRNDELLQLADMCAGAIARSYRDGRERQSRWREMLEPRIADLLELP